MLLESRNAVVYGAAGALGSAVSRAFAREGAAVFLTGRRRAPLEAVATKIRAVGGAAEVAVVDADSEQAVEEHAHAVVDRAGSLDISINLIGVDHIQGRPLVDMSPADFTLGLEARVHTHFVTARAAARHMMRQRSGAILIVTATPDRLAIPEVGSFGVANAALEGLTRTLATELSPHGVRVVCLRSAGSPDAAGVREAFGLHAANAGTTLETFTSTREERILLRRLPTLAEVADVAALMASDRASAMTATIANVTLRRDARLTVLNPPRQREWPLREVSVQPSGAPPQRRHRRAGQFLQRCGAGLWHRCQPAPAGRSRPRRARYRQTPQGSRGRG
jgi:3-oxoacyl-[acyl-carrier protein] reductase